MTFLEQISSMLVGKTITSVKLTPMDLTQPGGLSVLEIHTGRTAISVLVDRTSSLYVNDPDTHTTAGWLREGTMVVRGSSDKPPALTIPMDWEER